MRARVYSNGGNSTGGFTFNGGTLTGALFLAGNPSEPLEAASKQYLDSSLVNLNASNISSGILPSGRLPTFVGDLVKPAGSSTINLAPIGVVAGDYIKPTVDAKGRVTGGSSLVEADIPNISWDKVSLNRPTTLSGYGINNAILLSGGTLTGFLSFNGSVTGSLQAVTKQYIDVTLSSASGIAIGDIIRKPYTTTPPGFLKCNGGEVSKTTYNSLYSIINNRFSKQKSATFGQPWRQQYNINETQSGDINNWVVGTSIPASVSQASAIVTKNRVYLFGGLIAGVGVAATVYTALINADGTLGTWTSGTALPGVLCYSQATIIKNRVYLFGGSTDGNNSLTTVYTTTINSDGTLGTWTTSTALPGAMSNTHLIVTNTRIYLCGGNNGVTYLSTVYTALINSDGTLGAWSTGTSLPEAFYCGSAIITKNRVYICGGKNSAGTLTSTFTAVINTDGTLGTWTTANSLPSLVWTATPFITKNRVYLFGGTTAAGAAVSTVYTAAINADGTLGSWTIGTSLPTVLNQSQAIVTKNRIYLLGGYGTPVVYTASISGGMNDYSSYYAADITNYMISGSGCPWRQQYQINNSQAGDITGWTAGTSLPIAISHSMSLVTKNKVYLIGGNSSSGTDALSTTYVAPINSDGTLGTWTNSNNNLVTPMNVAVSIVTKNRVYILGGNNVNGPQSTVQTAVINSDGTLGTWTTGTALPITLAWSQGIVTKNRVYLIGGGNSTAIQSTVYTAPINSDGTLGTWVSALPLPIGIDAAQVVVTKNRVYLLGGWNSSGVFINTIYTTTVSSDGMLGIWSVYGSLPNISGHSQAIVVKNYVYLIGGWIGVTPGSLSSVYYAVINSDGTIGTWITGTSLPVSLGLSQAVVTKNHIYLLGGLVGTSQIATSVVYIAPILEGQNDYSSYYDGTVIPSDVIDPSTTFTLPDLTQSEKFDTVSYIKY